MSKLANYSSKLEKQGKLDEAITYLEMDIEQKTSSYDVRMDMGRILNKQGKYEDAIKNFDLVLSMSENHQGCLFGKGISYMGLNNWKKAYSFFLKVHKLNERNANASYYMAIILKDLNFDKESEDCFFNFLKYDRPDYKEERNSYRFGLVVEQRFNELNNIKRKVNVEEFRDTLKSLNVPSEKIDEYLHCWTYEDLIEEINSLRESRYNIEVKNTIYSVLSDMGLDDGSISDMFEVESVDSLKQKIIDSKGFNPFPEYSEPIEISRYVQTKLEKYLNQCIKHGWKIYPSVSKFNLLRQIKVSNKSSPYKMRTENFNIFSNYYRNKKQSKKYFEHGMMLISNNNGNGLNYLRMALEYCPSNEIMIYNIKFYYATALSKYGYLDSALKYYIELKSAIRNFEEIESFLFNFGNICYDLKYYKDALYFYDKYLKKNPDCEAVKMLTKNIKKIIDGD